MLTVPFYPSQIGNKKARQINIYRALYCRVQPFCLESELARLCLLTRFLRAWLAIIMAATRTINIAGQTVTLGTII